MAGRSTVPDPRREVDPRRLLGAFGEQAATDWYLQRGAELLDRNWRVREGEIDLVVAHQGAVIFAEVKTRRSTKFGLPVEAITRAKAARLRRLTGLWLRANREVRAAAIRIEIVSVFIDRSGRAHVEMCPLDV